MSEVTSINPGTSSPTTGCAGLARFLQRPLSKLFMIDAGLRRSTDRNVYRGGDFQPALIEDHMKGRRDARSSSDFHKGGLHCHVVLILNDRQKNFRRRESLLRISFRTNNEFKNPHG
jgi:hypothetical protein